LFGCVQAEAQRDPTRLAHEVTRRCHAGNSSSMNGETQRGINRDLMRLNGKLMGISWDLAGFNGIQWDLMGYNGI